MHRSILNAIRWVGSRVMVIYVVLVLFFLTCVDLKMLDNRIKLRHLNDAIPDFSDMIIFSKDQAAVRNLDWKRYQRYFKLILRYIPDDLITRQLLGFSDYYSSQEAEAIGLYKESSAMNGHPLFWSDYNLGVIYYKKGMWPQAAEYLFKTITANPKLTVLLMQDSIVYKQIFANSYFKYSLSDEIKDAQSHAYILLLASLGNMGQYDKMIAISDIALANKDLIFKDAFYYYDGIAYLKLGQIDKSFLLFQKSLTIEKDNPDVYYYLAGIYHRAGQLEHARDFLQVSYALHQKNDPRFPYDARTELRFF